MAIGGFPAGNRSAVYKIPTLTTPPYLCRDTGVGVGGDMCAGALYAVRGVSRQAARLPACEAPYVN